jgi:hypothetical protein
MIMIRRPELSTGKTRDGSLGGDRGHLLKAPARVGWLNTVWSGSDYLMSNNLGWRRNVEAVGGLEVAERDL